MILLLLLVLPFLTGLFLLCLNNNQAKKIAILATLLEFGLSLIALIQFKANNINLLNINVPWVSSLGIHFSVGIDGISMLLVLLSTTLMPLIVIATDTQKYPKINALLGLMLLMQSALIGVFTALDGFLFYVFWELALIPIYLICLLWGAEGREKITLKFFMYTLIGSLFMLIGLIYLYTQTPEPHNFSIQSLYSLNLSANVQAYIFWAFFLAFAIKMPIFPFHTWQPDTYVNAPTPGTMLLSGIMLKMGIYGAIRWLLPIAPLGTKTYMGVAITLSIIGIIYASIIAIQQNDLKRLVAYSSIAHVGLIAAGVFSLTYSGLQGSMVQMLAHGVNVVALFFIIDIILNRTKSQKIDELGGLAKNNPTLSVLFFIVVLGAIALPLTNGFVGEFLLLYGIFSYKAICAAFAGTSIILGAVYMLRAYQNTMLGTVSDANKLISIPLTKTELAVLIPCVTIIILAGVYPAPLLNIAEPSINAILQIIK